MVLGGGGDGVGFAGGFGIVAAHKPLKFGEFIDHFGRQIGLGETCGRAGLISIGPDHRGELSGQCLHARDQLGLCAQLIVEGHIGQTVHPCLHPGLRLRDAQIVFPEEFSVRQTCREHFFIARKNGRAIVGGGAIGNGDKAFDAARLGVAHREELLVLFHGGLQHLGRQTKEILANLPHQHDGIFYQPCDLCQKPRILDDLKPVGKGHIGRVVPDRIAPLCRVEHDKGAFQLGAVIFKVADGDRIRCHKAVPARGVASGDPVDVQRHNLRTILGRKDAQDRMQRTHPPQRATAPPHGFGPWEGANSGFQHFRHDLGCGAARLADHGKQDLALGGVALFQLVAGQPRAAQKPFDGFFRRVGLGAFAFLDQRRAGVQHPLDRQR